MKVGVIVAMDKEFDIIAQAWRSETPSSRNESDMDGCRMMRLYPSENNEVMLVRSGIGKVNAAIATLLLANEGVDCIISSGVAGSARTTSKQGESVIGSLYMYHDVYCGKEIEKGQVQGEPICYGADERLKEIAKSVFPEDYVGMFFSGDQFIDSKEVMEHICRDFPLALAVDMESCAIAQVCYKRNIPFISFRMLSDAILNPEAKSYDDFWSKVPLQMASNTTRYVMKVLQEYKPF